MNPKSLLLLAFVLASMADVQAQSRTSSFNDHQIAQALAGLGVSPDAPIMRGAVPRAFRELYPDRRYDRFRLTPIQARAVAYVAMLLALEAPRMMSPHEPEVAYCQDLSEAAYELSAAFPRQGGLFLGSDEITLLQRTANDIRRMASACGCYPVAELALELTDLAAEHMPDRSAVTDHITALRQAAMECR